MRTEKKICAVVLFLFVFLLSTLPKTANAEEQQNPAKAEEYVSVARGGSGVNIRAQASLSSEILRTVPPGYPLVVVERRGDWFLVDDYKERRGWVFASLLNGPETVIIKVQKGNLRNGPSLNDLVIAKLNQGSVVSVVETKGDWLQVTDSEGFGGWLHQDIVWPGARMAISAQESAAAAETTPVQEVALGAPTVEPIAPPKSEEEQVEPQAAKAFFPAPAVEPIPSQGSVEGQIEVAEQVDPQVVKASPVQPVAPVPPQGSEEEQIAVAEQVEPQVAKDNQAEALRARGVKEEAANNAEDEEVVREARPSQSVEDVVQAGHTLFTRKISLETGFTYTRLDRKQLVLGGFYALDAIFLGDISVDEVEADIYIFDITARYSLTDTMQIDVFAPFLYRNTVYKSTAPSGGTDKETIRMTGELGDISSGLSYHWFKETFNFPDVVWNVRVKFPTGSNPYGMPVHDVEDSNLLNIPDELPSGNGVWGLSSGLSFMKTVDPAILFLNLNYYYNFYQSFDDISSSPGNQPGEVKLGNTFQFGLGMAFALNERLSLALSYNHGFTSEAETRFEGGDWEEVTDSNSNSAVLGLGSTLALTDRLSMVTSLGAGLTNDAPDVQISFKFPYHF